MKLTKQAKPPYWITPSEKARQELLKAFQLQNLTVAQKRAIKNFLHLLFKGV
jgi:hypothetical protein